MVKKGGLNIIFFVKCNCELGHICKGLDPVNFDGNAYFRNNLATVSHAYIDVLIWF